MSDVMDANGPKSEALMGRGPADTAPLEIWVVTDGRAGNEKPALALAQGVAERSARGGAVRVKRLALRPGAALLPPALWTAPGAWEGGWPFVALEDRGGGLAPPYPDLAIGAGRRSAPFVLALKRLSGGGTRAVQLLDPQLDPKRFDLVIAPAHDGLVGPGTLTTIGSIHDVEPATAAPEDRRFAALGRPLIGLLIGGASRSARFEPEDADRLIDALRPAAAAGAGLAATPSRRTPAAVAVRLETEIRGFGGFYWSGSGDNPYRAILAQSDALVATADSVNMASEAAGTGKPLFIAGLSSVSAKLQRFHDALQRGGYARPLPPRLEPADLTEATGRRLDDRGAAVARILDFVDRPSRAGPRFG